MANPKQILNIFGWIIILIITAVAIIFIPEATILFTLVYIWIYTRNNRRQVTPATTAESSKTLRNNTDDIVCSICTDQVNVQEDDSESVELTTSTAVDLLCGHYFHAGCLKKWNEQDYTWQIFRMFMMHDRTCPNCRARIPDGIIAYLDDLDLDAESQKKTN